MKTPETMRHTTFRSAVLAATEMAIDLLEQFPVVAGEISMKVTRGDIAYVTVWPTSSASQYPQIHISIEENNGGGFDSHHYGYLIFDATVSEA